MDFEVQKARFDRICARAMRERHSMGDDGIGTMREKRMHAVIKQYLCEDESCHEVAVGNTRFVSDVRIGSDAYEVQTGAFYPMQKKIAYYMERTDLTVTVVHPISVLRWMCWIDPETKEITPRKRVGAHEHPADLLPELYCLLPYLQNPRLKFRLLLLETQDFRMLDGWSKDRKKGASRYERVPISLIGEEEFLTPSDFLSLLPACDLPERFTVKQFSALTKLHGRNAYSAVRVLCALGLLKQTDPVGRSMAFCRLF